MSGPGRPGRPRVSRPRRKASEAAPIGSNPANALVVGIDPGEVSGIGYSFEGDVIQFSTVEKAEHRQEIVVSLFEQASDLNLPIVVVMEKWTAGGKAMNPEMLTGLGQQAGRWLQCFEQAHALFSDQLVVYHRVYPQTWRAAIFGSSAHRAKSDALKRLAQATAVQILGWEPAARVLIDHNIAEALCMMRFGELSLEIKSKLSDMKRRAERKSTRKGV